jgi:hypothetical protein
MDIRQDQVGVSHLHLNVADISSDFNILLPIHRFQELLLEGRIGGLAAFAYSFMGYQGFPPDTTAWEEIYGPQVAENFKSEEVDCVFLTPSWPDCTINVPVLARTLEHAGLSTILVTNMPYWAEKVGVPRTFAVEFPFGHTLGRPHDVSQQMRVIREALNVLETAKAPGTIVHSEEIWPIPQDEAIRAWQPEKPSPIIEHLAPRFREMLRQRRKGITWFELDFSLHKCTLLGVAIYGETDTIRETGTQEVRLSFVFSVELC